MFAPSTATHMLADKVHHERQSHAQRLQAVAHEKGPDGTPVSRETHRRITVRRLTAGAAGTLLSIAVAGAALAALGPNAEAAPAIDTGAGGHGAGGPTLIR